MAFNILFYIFRLERNTQHLVFHLLLRKKHKVCSSLFSCSQLRYLELHDCSIHHLSSFQGFNKLLNLELYEVTISPELLESLISHCPLLEQLVLDDSENFDKIEINTPMLRVLHFVGNLCSLCLKNVPRLVELSLVANVMQEEDLDFAKVFVSSSVVEHLSVSFLNSRNMSTNKASLYLNSVKQFCMPRILLVESYKLSYVPCLIRSVPCLEYLEIQIHSEDDIDTDDESTEVSLDLKCLSDVTFNHLREVKLEIFTGRTSEMQFIRFLLANSLVLERMLIDGQFLDDESLDTRLEIFAEVSNFSRASTKAEIVYVDLSESA